MAKQTTFSGLDNFPATQSGIPKPSRNECFQRIRSGYAQSKPLIFHCPTSGQTDAPVSIPSYSDGSPFSTGMNTRFRNIGPHSVPRLVYRQQCFPNRILSLHVPSPCLSRTNGFLHVHRPQRMLAPTFTLLPKQMPFVYPLNSFVLQAQKSATPRRSRIRISREVFCQCKPFSAHEPFEALDDVKSVRQKSGGVYAPFWQESEIRAGIAKKELLTGTLRINPRQYNDAYIKHPIGDCDVYIPGLRKRNRALTNDIVAVLLEEKKFWRVFGTFVKESIDPNVEKTVRGNNALSYCTLEEFIAHQKHDLEQLIGVEMVKNIVIDLNTSTDPLPPPTPSLTDSTTVQSVPWWTVIQRTGRVVGIVHQLHSRTCIGYLQVTRTAFKSKTVYTQDVQDSQSSSSLTVVKKESASWNYANLIPSDYRLPRIIIPRSSCPEALQVDPDSFKHVRFVAKIVEWAENSIFPKGKLLRSLSSESQNLIDFETDRILIGAGFVHGLDAINQFPESVTISAQQAVAEATSALSEELRWRKDFREHCVFTIDPSTARDLDDALHLRDLSDDEIQLLAAEGYENAAYEVKLLLFKFHVGVHIADVSYFVRPDSAVDVEASRRATTIYLVQLCVPMLPRLLCEELCSLNPNEHKLSFSVVFKVTKQGEILKTWFGRTIIRSCAKFSYEDVQLLIDNPEEDFVPECTPDISPPHTLQSVHSCILKLHELAMQRRHRRFANGSLRLDQVKSIFLLDDNRRFPVGVSLAICKPSNSLVEEWMLAANEAVAKHLATHLPNSAFLRRHPAPSLNQLHNAAITLESVGIKVNTETAGSIQASICRAAGCAVDTGYHYSSDLVSLCSTMAAGLSLVETDLIEKLEQVELNANPDPKRRSFQDRKEELEREARLLVAVSMLTKTMTLAEYFCLGELSSDSTTEHYALNMEFYTHFTSPIRRYADVIVHRQLAATLSAEALKAGDDDLAAWYAQTIPSTEVSTKELQTVAEVCNAKKLSARIASEESTELFFILFVKETGPLTEVCAITAILDRSFDVLLLSCGLTRRVYLQNLNIRSSELVAVRRVGNRIEETAKLCILWNTESTSGELSATTRTQTSSDDVTIGSALATVPSCGCYYTELKLLDVVLCQVSIERPDDDNLNENANQTDMQQTQVKTLPKLRLTLLRRTCSKCQSGQ
ncbi:hypothetical protein P879_06877 [Paragonimus westermani]|uniref:RNB domain-containing protein n=1 Tax=Paragonimus westermani TaxID=34504 RepID=A0A8T0DCL2_9TREM|nr:hypothetical protein P879_06877 [Paragonimus westermani]